MLFITMWNCDSVIWKCDSEIIAHLLVYINEQSTKPRPITDTRIAVSLRIIRIFFQICFITVDLYQVS